MKNKTPSYPPVRGGLVTFSACVLPQGRSLYLTSPLQGIRGGLIHSGAHIVNLLTNEIHARKSVRKYAILADSAML